MDDELKKLAPILEALRRVEQDATTYQMPLDAVNARFMKLLSEEVTRHASSTTGLMGKACLVRHAVLKAVHPPRACDELLERIRRACELTDRQVRLLRDTGLIATDEKGRPIIRNSRDVLLTHEKAALYLFAIGCLSGMSIWSIVVDSAPGIGLIFRGIGLGIALGSIAGFVLGRSYRAYPILEKLVDFQPWLSSQPIMRKV